MTLLQLNSLKPSPSVYWLFGVRWIELDWSGIDSEIESDDVAWSLRGCLLTRNSSRMHCCMWWCDRAEHRVISATSPSSSPMVGASGIGSLMTPSNTTVNGQLPGSQDKSPSSRQSFQSASNNSEDVRVEDPHISFIELPITISRAMSPEQNSLVDLKEFHFHVPHPTQVDEFTIYQMHKSYDKKKQDSSLGRWNYFDRKRDRHEINKRD